MGKSYRRYGYHADYDSERYNRHKTGVWVVYKGQKHVGYVNARSENDAITKAEDRYGNGSLHVSEIEE